MPLTKPQGNMLMKAATESATTSGSSVEFTGIPPGTMEIHILLDGVSTNGTNLPGVQLGDADGYEVTGYVGTSSIISNGASPSVGQLSGGAFHVGPAWGPSQTLRGIMVLTRQDASHTWCCSWFLSADTGATQLFAGAGTKQLSAELTSIKLLTGDTFDAGSVSIAYF